MANLDKVIEQTMVGLNKNKAEAIIFLLQKQTSILSNTEDKIRSQLDYMQAKELVYLLNEYIAVDLNDPMFEKFFKDGEKRRLIKGSPADKDKIGEISLVKIYAQQYKEEMAVYEELMQELLKVSKDEETTKKEGQPGEE